MIQLRLKLKFKFTGKSIILKGQTKSKMMEHLKFLRAPVMMIKKVFKSSSIKEIKTKVKLTEKWKSFKKKSIHLKKSIARIKALNFTGH